MRGKDEARLRRMKRFCRATKQSLFRLHVFLPEFEQKKWWRGPGSNRGHKDFQSFAFEGKKGRLLVYD